MDPALILGLILLSVIAGLIGSLFGLGGGIIVVPVLTVLYDLPAHEAVAISLVTITAISSASASALVRDRIANVRLGMTIKVAAASGAVIGSVIALFVQSDALTLSFAFVMIYSAVYMFLRPERRVPDDEAEGEDVFVYHDHRTEKDVRYRVRNIRTGMVGFLVGGIISPLSGVGGGAINVPIMNVHMNIPMKVATATSSLIIGITAFMGAVVYLLNGVLDVQTASVVVIGAFAGSELGIRILPKIDTASLRRYFSVVLVFLAMVMFLKVGGVL